MAISLSSSILHSTPNFHNELRFDKLSFTKSPSQTSVFGCLESKRKLATRKSTIKMAVSESKDSLSSMTAELKKENKIAVEGGGGGVVTRELADSWREIHGQNDWAGMFDPIDPLLRTELTRYGEMAQACYDAFDWDQFSRYCGSCRFQGRTFFESLGLKANHGYEVSRYLYATANIRLPNFSKKSRLTNAWSNNANWIGYVSVSDDETSRKIGRRDIVISWRGTITSLEWISDLMFFSETVSPARMPCPDPEVKIETGFLHLYTDKDVNCRFCKHSAREQVLTEMRRLITKYPNEELSITITGHSLGGALAVLSAYDIAETGVNVAQDGRVVPVCAFTFAGPRVGNVRFKERVEKIGVKVLRVVNVHDIVPKSPGFLCNENTPQFLKNLVENLPISYSHVGVNFALDHKISPFSKEDYGLANFHNLEAYLHLLDGYHGKGNKFKLTTGRDTALVNKSSAFLKDEHIVPPCWRQDQNKGMVMDKDGKWVLPERPILDDHPEDMQYHLKELGLLK